MSRRSALLPLALVALVALGAAAAACGRPDERASETARAAAMPTTAGERTEPMPVVPHADSGPRPTGRADTLDRARGADTMGRTPGRPGTITVPPFPQRPDTTRPRPTRPLPPEPSSRRPTGA